MTTERINVYPERTVLKRHRLVLLTGLALYFGFMTMRFGQAAAGADLDPSWSTVIAWAFEHRLAWGRDIVFTFGPLGFLTHSTAYWPALYGVFLAGQVFIGAACAVAFWFAARDLDGPDTVVLAAIVVAWMPWLAGDSSRMLAILLAYGAVRAAAHMPRAWLGAALVVLAEALMALLTLIKLSALPLLAVWYLAAAVALRSRRALLAAHVLGFPLALAALWLASGQALSDVPAYVGYVIEISGGYGAAMSLPPAPYAEAAGFGCLLLAGAWMLRVLWVAGPRRPDAVAATLLAGACVFIAWRAAYTRADAHVEIFFPVAVLAVLALRGVLDADVGARLGRSAALVAVVATAIGLTVVSQPLVHWREQPGVARALASTLLRPHEAVAANEAILAGRRAAHALPRVRDTVGDDPVDLLMNRQGVVFLNALNYAPRPVFQGYSAYTPALARLNERYLLSGDAPKWLLLAVEAIDGRWPMSEDALALAAIARRYAPVMIEGDFLLLERRDASLPPVAAAGPAAAARFGEWQSLDDTQEPLLLFADVRQTIPGRVYAFLFREPALMLDVRFEDGSTSSHRIVRNVASSGFLVSPAVQTTAEFLRLQVGMESARVAAFRLRPASSRIPAFGAEYAYRVQPMAIDHRGLRHPRILADLYPGFSHWPVEQEGLVEQHVVEQRPVVFAHSPARFAFDPGPGSYVASAHVGVEARALEDPGCHAGDGIAVELRHRGATGTVALGRRVIDPFHDPSARGFQTVAAPVALAAGETVELVVDPNGNTACDWGLVETLRFEPAAAAQ